MDTSKKVTIAVVIILIAGAIAFAIYSSNKKGVYDGFAQCLKDQGAKFYGAFWCPHCQAQEREFGMSRQKLEAIDLYTECSNPDGASQTQVCTDNKIEGYPTWTFTKPIVLHTKTNPIVSKPGEGGNESKLFTQWVFTLNSGEAVRVMTTSTPTTTGEGNEKTYTFDPATSRLSGETSLALLSEETGCQLPAEK